MNIYNTNNKNSNWFVTPKELYTEYLESIKINKCTDKMLKLFEKMVRKYAVSKLRNANKIDIDACVNYAIFEAYLKWFKFNEKVSNNIFSFYNTMLANDLMIHYNYITKGKYTSISFDVLFSCEKK